MSILKEAFGIDATPLSSMLLKGYLIKEEGTLLWIQDQRSTWIIKASDIVGRDDWSGIPNSRIPGTPGLFYVQDGAEICEVRTVKVKIADRPLAIGDATYVDEVLGASDVDALAVERFGKLLRSGRDGGAGGMSYSWCKGPDGNLYICDNYKT